MTNVIHLYNEDKKTTFTFVGPIKNLQPSVPDMKDYSRVRTGKSESQQIRQLPSAHNSTRSFHDDEGEPVAPLLDTDAEEAMKRFKDELSKHPNDSMYSFAHSKLEEYQNDYILMERISEQIFELMKQSQNIETTIREFIAQTREHQRLGYALFYARCYCQFRTAHEELGKWIFLKLTNFSMDTLFVQFFDYFLRNDKGSEAIYYFDKYKDFLIQCRYLFSPGFFRSLVIWAVRTNRHDMINLFLSPEHKIFVLGSIYNNFLTVPKKIYLSKYFTEEEITLCLNLLFQNIKREVSAKNLNPLCLDESMTKIYVVVHEIPPQDPVYLKCVEATFLATVRRIQNVLSNMTPQICSQVLSENSVLLDRRSFNSYLRS